MKALGLKVSYGASFVHTHDVDAGIDETTGEIFRTESTTFDNGRVKMTPDVGWSYNPGSAAFGTDQTLIRKVIETRDPQLREQVIQSLNNSRERQLAFSVWAKRTLASGRAGDAVQTLGFMSESVAAMVRARAGLSQPDYWPSPKKVCLMRFPLQIQNSVIPMYNNCRR